MGYKISSLANIPTADGMLYCFHFGNIWKNTESGVIEENFDLIARRLGDNASWITGHDDNDLAELLLTEVSQYRDNLGYFPNDSLDSLFNCLDRGRAEGAILILFNHPVSLGHMDSFSFLYSPLNHLIDRSGGIELFLNSLVEFAKSGGVKFLEKFQEPPLSKYLYEGLILKPSFFGIGFNLKSILKQSNQRIRVEF